MYAARRWPKRRYDVDIFVNCNWVAPGGNSTVHIYTQTIHRTAQLTNWEECGLCPIMRRIPLITHTNWNIKTLYKVCIYITLNEKCCVQHVIFVLWYLK